MTEAYIYDAIRTPRGRGKRDGSLHTVKPLDLVVGLIDEVRGRFPDMDVNRIDDVLLGVVTPVGDQGACIAKTAALAAGLPDTVAGYQLNRFCASGLEAVNTGAQKVASGWDDLILAGGVEAMSRIPMGSDGGAWAMDPITNYETGFVPQGIGADLIATIEGFSRRDVDEFAAESQARAANAWDKGYFQRSVVPVKDRNGMTVDQMDLVEINEAFASVAMRFMRDMGLDHDKVNVNGGAIAMGHPLGATGAMILGTALDELERRDKKFALCTLCVGGGMGIATIIERL